MDHPSSATLCKSVPLPVPEHFQSSNISLFPSSPVLGSGLLSYANAGLTSAVRSKWGRGTLELSLPSFRLTHSLSSSPTLLCPARTHWPTRLWRTPCVPARSYSATPCWILLKRLADCDTERIPRLGLDFSPLLLIYWTGKPRSTAKVSLSLSGCRKSPTGCLRTRCVKV